ncbi:predicted protein [Lichtheimia corymbifera JMRC:FSU:9682]|uniref:Uncharacterized protein n=1 Tax=Lichtheimia corymbifera JMRC:FSU:9682 TaxID=1263082 RepID=A0A068RKF4_9FUNG|nr:predicted protein [Lichtheimia corymbifera JMRC:FSU:9682]
MKSSLYTLSFLLGAVAVNAQMTDRQTSPAQPGGLAFAAANDRQTSPIGAGSMNFAANGDEDGNVFPSDMFFHHHPSKAMAFALAGDHQSAPVSNGGPELRQGQGEPDAVMNDMYLHHHPNKVSMAAGTPRLAADAGKRLKWREATSDVPFLTRFVDEPDTVMNDMYLHHHPNKVSMAANGGGQQLDANAGGEVPELNDMFLHHHPNKAMAYI